MSEPLENEDNPENKNPIAKTVDDQTPKEAPSDRPNKTGLFFPAVGQGRMAEGSEKTWASLAHITSLAGPFTGGVGYVVGPAVIYLLKKGESPFVDEHTKETLNFSIITTLAIWITGAIGFLSCFLWIVTLFFAVANFIYCLQGFFAARNGEAFRYPFNFRIIK